jgi:hypothetical protein
MWKMVIENRCRNEKYKTIQTNTSRTKLYMCYNLKNHSLQLPKYPGDHINITIKNKKGSRIGESL